MTRRPRTPAPQGAPTEPTPDHLSGEGAAKPGQVFFSASDLRPIQGSPVPEASGPSAEFGAAPGDDGLGRHAFPSVPPATTPLPVPGPAASGSAASDAATARPGREPKGPPLPSAERRNRARFWTFLRLLGGVLTLGALAYVMWTGGEWQNLLLLWVFLTIFADEFGGWFGYVGLLLGGLGYLSPNTPPEAWLTLLPLIGGALMALLLVKHSGGPLVLPFAGLLFAGTLLAVARYGLKFDPQLKLPANDLFLRSALLAAAAGLAFSFVRQLIGLLIRRQARVRERRAEQAALLGAAG